MNNKISSFKRSGCPGSCYSSGETSIEEQCCYFIESFGGIHNEENQTLILAACIDHAS